MMNVVALRPFKTVDVSSNVPARVTGKGLSFGGATDLVVWILSVRRNPNNRSASHAVGMQDPERILLGPVLPWQSITGRV